MKKKKKRNTPSIIGTLDVLALGLTTATLLGFLGRFFWVFDLFSHFRVQYMQLCLILIGIALWKRLNKRAVALVLLACLNYAYVLPLYFGKPEPAAGKPIRAMLINLNAMNGNTEEVLKSIRSADPDLLLLEEVTSKWMEELAVLNTDYRHRVAEPQEGCFGIMLASKYPLENEQVIDIGNSGLPSITAVIYFPQGEVFVVGTHPVPPIGHTYSKRRNALLMELPYLTANQKHPTLLIGDLNVSPFSYWFKRVRETGLQDSAKGFGFQPTWPADIPFMKIPLDHVLHSPEIIIHNRAVGENVGSDHLPVIVDFSLR